MWELKPNIVISRASSPAVHANTSFFNRAEKVLNDSKWQNKLKMQFLNATGNGLTAEVKVC